MSQITLLHQILKLQKVNEAFMMVLLDFNFVNILPCPVVCLTKRVKLDQKKGYIITFSMTHTTAGIHKNAKEGVWRGAASFTGI